MKWTKTSDWSITTGRFHIAKALVMGEPKYTLWDNTRIVGTWDTPEEAKNAALDIRHIHASAGEV